MLGIFYIEYTDGLGPRYKQPCGGGVHIDISTHLQERVKVVHSTFPYLSMIVLIVVGAVA